MPFEPVTFEHFEVARLPDGSLHELGRGTMGVTYKAFDTRLGSFVALKVINTDAITSEVARLRFEREAKAAAHLNHPNVAAIFHRGQEGGTYFYAMQFIEGETFDAFVKRRGPLPAAMALRLILQAAQGLAAASTRGLIHRDIKPANLMLVHPDRDAAQPAGPDDTGPDDDELLVKVIDFGLAKYLHKPGEDAAAASLTGDRIVGTPHYMSPEQIDPVGREIDARADIYALGVTLWHLLAGNPPFRGTEYQVFNQHMNQSLPWEQLPPAVPPQIHDLLERMMAKDPANRPASHRELIVLIKQQLRALSTGEPIPPGPAAAANDTAAGLPGSLPPAADHTLADVVKIRGGFTTGDVLVVLSHLAPLVDALRGARTYDLDPAQIGIRFDQPPYDPEGWFAQELQHWPPWQLEVVPRASGASDTAHPAAPLGRLVYELLTGHPPADPYEPVASVNERVNALLRQVIEETDAFGSAVRFSEAFRLAQAGELRVPAKAAEGVSVWENQATANQAGNYATVGSLLTKEVKQARRFPWGVAAAVVVLLASAGWWLFAGGPGGSVAGWSLAQAPAYVQPSPTPTATPVPTAPPVMPATSPAVGLSLGGQPEVGSITTRAVRRYAPPPFFPPAAKAAHQQGKVWLGVDVDAAGNVTGVTVKGSSGFPLLDDAAVQSARAWKFDPARTNQIPVPSHVEMPVEFKDGPADPPSVAVPNRF